MHDEWVEEDKPEAQAARPAPRTNPGRICRGRIIRQTQAGAKHERPAAESSESPSQDRRCFHRHARGGTAHLRPWTTRRLHPSPTWRSRRSLDLQADHPGQPAGMLLRFAADSSVAAANETGIFLIERIKHMSRPRR